MHETLSENNSTGVSKSKHNIVNETLSQNNSTEVPENTISELKDKEHKEPSVTQKVTSYFNIFECGRNILDQLDVTYQRAVMATPAEYEYYKEMMKSIIKGNNEGGKLCNDKIQQAVIDLRAELNVEYESNINNISCNDFYQYYTKKKDVPTIIDYVYNKSDEHIDKISDSSKQFYARNEPIKETHIVDGINHLSVGVVSVEPAIIGVGVIGQGITQGVINRD